ncbi:MAG: trigger factor [Candidatus Dojkabacteria bacterium]
MKYDYKVITKTKDKHEFEVTVDFKELDPFIDRAYEKLSKDVKIAGFRPGKAPKEKIMAKIGSDVSLMALNALLPEVAFEIMQKENSRPTAPPQYDLKKVNEKDGIIFTFTYVNYPEVTLGDFSKIKVEKDKVEVKDEDVDNVIRSLIRQNLKPERLAEVTGVDPNAKKEAAKQTRKEETKEGKKANLKKKKEKEVDNFDTFELTDELVKEINIGYENLAQVREEVRKRLEEVRKENVEQDYLQKIIEEAIKLSKFEIPVSFIEGEVKLAEQEYMERIHDLKLDLSTFLASQGKTIEDLRKEWAEAAKKRIGRDLVLIKLANDAGKVATDEDVQKEIDMITDPKVKAKYKSQSAREYIKTVITRQRGMDILVDKVTKGTS